MINLSTRAVRTARLATIRIVQLRHLADVRIDACLCQLHRVRNDIRDLAVYASYLFRPLDVRMALDGGDLEESQP